MTQSTSNDNLKQQPARETEADVAKERSGATDKSSGDHMSRQKAGKDEGAGGGAKQEQNH